jgi:multimeric flavodoxin WrbA
MRLLGLTCGNPDGNADILLKAALMAAEERGLEVAMLRLDDLRIPVGPVTGSASPADDGPWFWDTLMESDALIISAPVYTRTPPGQLKLLCDRVLGPTADAAFAMEYIRMRDAGETPPVRFPFDERVLRNRVGGFISTGGALTDHWLTLALPLLHHMTFSMQIGVVDQVQLAGAGVRGSVLIDDAAIARAELLGRNVAEQVGRAFDDVEYRGEPGLCPMCHLDVMVLRADAVECAVCGARGQFHVEDGAVSVRFSEEGLRQSILTIAEKRAHFLEVQETAIRQSQRAGEIAELGRRYTGYDRSISPATAAGAAGDPARAG